jgi:hypothetical protein
MVNNMFCRKGKTTMNTHEMREFLRDDIYRLNEHVRNELNEGRASGSAPHLLNVYETLWEQCGHPDPIRDDDDDEGGPPPLTLPQDVEDLEWNLLVLQRLDRSELLHLMEALDFHASYEYPSERVPWRWS